MIMIITKIMIIYLSKKINTNIITKNVVITKH